MDWTFEALVIHMDQRFTDLDRRMLDNRDSDAKAVSAALAAAALAVDKAEDNAARWRESANEWRGAMDDRERTFLHREEATIRFDQLSKDIDALASSRDVSSGRASGMRALWATILGASAIGIALWTAVINNANTLP